MTPPVDSSRNPTTGPVEGGGVPHLEMQFDDGGVVAMPTAAWLDFDFVKDTFRRVGRSLPESAREQWINLVIACFTEAEEQ